MTKDEQRNKNKKMTQQLNKQKDSIKEIATTKQPKNSETSSNRNIWKTELENIERNSNRNL